MRLKHGKPSISSLYSASLQGGRSTGYHLHPSASPPYQEVGARVRLSPLPAASHYNESVVDSVHQINYAVGLYKHDVDVVADDPSLSQ